MWILKTVACIIILEVILCSLFIMYSIFVPSCRVHTNAPRCKLHYFLYLEEWWSWKRMHTQCLASHLNSLLEPWHERHIGYLIRLGGTAIKEMVNMSEARIKIFNHRDLPACASRCECVLQARSFLEQMHYSTIEFSHTCLLSRVVHWVVKRNEC